MNNANFSINRILSDPRYALTNNTEINKYNHQKNNVSKSKITKTTKIQITEEIDDMDIINKQIEINSKQNLKDVPKQNLKELPKQIKDKVNGFKILSFGKVNTRQDYLADVGLISPPYVITDKFQIIPFELITEKQMVSKIINSLNNEFGHDMAYSEDIINKTWTGANVFYVMTSSDKTKFYGTIAIDRKNFYPYISQLYIVEDERYRNLGKHLINFANRYIKSLNFTQSRLWCENKLVQYYSRLGWKYEGKQKDLNIMVFDL
jgi:hypothetical protein